MRDWQAALLDLEGTKSTDYTPPSPPPTPPGV